MYDAVVAVLPNDADELYTWMACLSVVYLATASIIAMFAEASRGRRPPSVAFSISRIFDAGTFSASATLFAGFIHPPILSLIGDTKPFLLVAALAGLTYSIHALAPK